MQTGRTVKSLALTAALAGATLLPSIPPAGAKHGDPEPHQHMQVVVRRLHVVHDGDPNSGAGELHFKTILQRRAPGCPNQNCEGVMVEWKVSASSGETVDLDVQVRDGGDMVVHPGESLQLLFAGTEEDAIDSIPMGVFDQEFFEPTWGAGLSLQAYLMGSMPHIWGPATTVEVYLDYDVRRVPSQKEIIQTELGPRIEDVLSPMPTPTESPSPDNSPGVSRRVAR